MKKGKDDLAQAFGDALKSAREEKGVSQERLAMLANIDRSHVGRLERGERVPSLAAIVLLARPLGLTPSELVKKVEKRLR